MTNWDVNFHNVTVKMSDGSVFAGKVNIRNYQRLSDFFKNADERFIVVIPDEEHQQRASMVNKQYIIWAEAND